jgi:hypothetical protein
MSTKATVRSSAVAATIVSVWILLPNLSQSSTPFRDFLSLGETEKASLQLKLTYVRPQLTPCRSLVLHAIGREPDPAAFEKFDQPGLDYAGDVGVVGVPISATEMDSILIAMSSATEIIGSSFQENAGSISVSLHSKGPPEKQFESFPDEPALRNLFAILRSSLARNAGAYQEIQNYACKWGLLEDGRPQYVDSSVRVTFSDLQRLDDPSSFIGTAQLKNTSTLHLAGPISLVLEELPSQVELVNSTAFTCAMRMTAWPQPYVDVAGASDGLDPGEEVEVRLEFNNPHEVPLGACRCSGNIAQRCDSPTGSLCGPGVPCVCSPTVSVLAGPGAR